MRLFFFDFEDSFSWNIVRYLEVFFSDIKMVPLQEHRRGMELVEREESPVILVFGPGPHRPEKYPEILSFIGEQVKKEFHFLVGICLGHQAILQSLGYPLRYSLNPYHGIQVPLTLNSYWKKILNTQLPTIKVQRYNSLCIEGGDEGQDFFLQDKNGELMAFQSKKILSYQFHPESIGTENPECFFQAILHLFNGPMQIPPNGVEMASGG